MSIGELTPRFNPLNDIPSGIFLNFQLRMRLWLWLCLHTAGVASSKLTSLTMPKNTEEYQLLRLISGLIF